MNRIRAIAGLLILGTGCTILLAGSGPPCRGEFCVDISSSFFSNEQCIGSPGKQCTYANVYFTAKKGAVNVTNLVDAGVIALSINDRAVGVEGNSQLTTSNGLVIQLLLDRSYSITQSGSSKAVRDGAVQFIRGLSSAALIGVSVFASESDVPIFLNSSGMESTTTQLLYNKATAESIVAGHYAAYPAQVSESQTKLYDAVGELGKRRPTGNNSQLLQNVMVVFTDGADTASKNFTSADAVRAGLAADAPDLKVYAIGLGAEPNAQALGTISNDRFYRATNATDLQKAFDEVAKELTAIYFFKVLVASVESGATGRLKVTYEGNTVEQTFKMSSSTVGGSGGGGGGGGGSFTVTITSATSATPFFSWPGTVADSLQVEKVTTGETMWAISATGSGFSSNVKYGTTPAGATVTTSARTLVSGTQYRILVGRSDGAQGTSTFTR